MALEKLTSLQVDNLIKEYKRGRSLRCVAKDFGVTDGTVIRYLELNHVDRRPAGGVLQTTPDLVDMAIAMRAQGLPWKKVSDHIGITTSTLLRHIKTRNSQQ